MLELVMAAVLAVSVQEHLEGSEIGDATQFISLRTGGRYYAERQERSGRTVARGKWRVEGDRLEVMVTSCKGPACGTLGKPWRAQVEVLADRAMTVRAETPAAPLSSGSYYCRSQGCEKRIGVELIANGIASDDLENLLVYLIDKNRTRDLTVVWIAPTPGAAAPSTRVVWCGRDGDRARDGASLVASDLRDLGWSGQIRPAAGADCLYDVRVMVGSDLRPPPPN